MNSTPAGTTQVTSIDEVLQRGVVEVVVRDHLRRRLLDGVPLRVKFGVDPTRPDIHLGHVVCFRKLRQFQTLGHRVVVVVGDRTARIGDPSGRSVQRQMLSSDEVQRNAETYLQQFFKVVDVNRAEIVWQSEWFNWFTLNDVIQLTSKYTVAQMLAREDFEQRYRSGSPIAITELLYPLMQAYDSVAVRADVEIGGTDQTFNLLVGRDIQREMGQEPQDILTVPILVGTDGTQKMSKSLGNYIAVNDPPDDMFGKVMSIPDHVLRDYFYLLTDLPESEIDALAKSIDSGEVNPRDVKQQLAAQIVAEFHSPEAAERAQANFDRVFRHREVPEHVPDVSVPKPSTIRSLLVRSGMAKTNNEARRLITQGGVRVGSRRVIDAEEIVTVEQPTILQVGKRRFVRLVPEQ